MSKRLFVGGLSYNLTEAQLKDLFAEVGTVSSCNVIIDRFTGRSKGFGFVEMENDKEADKAIETLNGKELDGRKITVNVARPLEERPARNYQSDRRDYSRGPRRNSNQRRY